MTSARVGVIWLIDVASMPGYNEGAINAGVQDGKVHSGAGQKTARVVRRDEGALDRQRSVTRGRVYWGLPAHGGGVETVCCVDHGATNCVSKIGDGTLWRCTACNEGAFRYG